MGCIKKLLKAIKIICTCKSSCFIGEDIKMTLDNKDENIILKISYV